MTEEAKVTPRAGLASAARRAARWLFVNRRTGTITVAQWPNVVLWTYLVSTVVDRLAGPKGTVLTAVRVLADVALLVWALDEIVRGVNPFRRALGSVVLLATVGSLTVWGHWP